MELSRFKKISVSIITLAFCIMLIVLVIVSFSREQRFRDLYKDKVADFSETLATKWLNAVKENNPIKAIRAAAEIVPVQYPYLPKLSYIAIAESAKIGSNFFNPPFNKIDFLYWRDMLLMKKIVEKLNYNPSNALLINKIFTTVNERIKLKKYKKTKDRPAFLSQIWKNKEGDLIDKYILFSSLTEQAGFNTQIALICSKKEEKPLFILAVCEQNGNFFIYDFSSGSKIMMPLDKLLKDEKKCFDIFGKKWRNGEKLVIFKNEQSSLNYRQANQLLGSFLSKSKNSEIPQIGEDPNEHQKDFMKSLQNKNNTAFALGVEPFLMLKNYKHFPPQWKYREPEKEN